MRQLITRYWFYVVLALAIIIGSAVAHWSYTAWVAPSQPYMIVDTDHPSKDSPVGFEPVERTGKAPSQGKKVVVTCKVPEDYVKYLHYPEDWERSIFNPMSSRGQVVKWSLYSVLLVIIGLLAWRLSVMFIKKRKDGGEA